LTLAAKLGEGAVPRAPDAPFSLDSFGALTNLGGKQ